LRGSGSAPADEIASRLKANGRLIGYSPLSPVLELDGLIMGITGKLEMWRSLQAIENGSRIAVLTSIYLPRGGGPARSRGGSAAEGLARGPTRSRAQLASTPEELFERTLALQLVVPHLRGDAGLAGDGLVS
jgi:hypothetical protein